MAYVILMTTTMTAKEYRDALERLEMTQGTAGALFGVGPRTSRRWALDEAKVPVAVSMILRLMLKKQLKLEVPASPFIESKGRLWTLSADYALLE
jgi:hypothetical protein